MKTKIKIWIYPFIAMGLVLIITNSCRKSDSIYDPIVSKVYTTLDRTVIPATVSSWPVLYPYEISKFSSFPGYGVWHYGPGLGYQKRLDIMSPSYNSTPVTKAANLLNFFAITDIHITDEETPASAIFFGYKGGLIGGYSPVCLLTTQVLDAAVRTINTLHKGKPFDFGISIGDVCNNTQYNELRWYIDILDGKYINPDSGIKDDPIPGPDNDYQDPFQAAGLDKSIPWYQTLGNHDHFWTGLLSPNDYARYTYTHEEILNLDNILVNDQFAPQPFDSRGFYIGSIDGSTRYGTIIGVGPTDIFSTPPKVRAADPDRHSLFREEWMSEFFTTTSNPVGHGFSQSNVTTGFACYTFEPKTGIPVKVIVLDDTQSNDDPNNNFYGHSSLDMNRYNWLIGELDKGQKEGKLMIISAHIPIGVLPSGDAAGWNPTAPVSEDTLIANLHKYPNFILWMSGHRHLNTITPMPSPDATHPECGFWEVETTSLRDLPQQFRMFEIVRNSDNNISIFTTDVDPIIRDGSLPALSRSYAVAAQQIFNVTKQYGPSCSYNAELVKQLTPDMQAKIHLLGKQISK